MEKTIHIAVIPSAGLTHLIPIIEFSKKMLQLCPDFHVTCIIPTLGSPSSATIAYLQSLPSNLHYNFLPPVHEEDIMPHQNDQPVHIAVQIQRVVTLSLPYIRQELESLSSRNGLAALVTDTFAMEALDIGSELNILSYVYCPYSAMALSLFMYAPDLVEKTISMEFRDLQDPIKMPGCAPIQGRDLIDSVQDRSNLVYKQFLERCRRLNHADGILVNSFPELETETIKALQEGFKDKPQIYSVGPILQSGSSSSEPHGLECLKWLNNQPPRSVLYVSFGSGGTLSQDQLNELALGLELSGEKFLWVVRAPSNFASAAYLALENKNPLNFLPEGFMKRIKEKGLVIPSWAPQIQILSHNSTGGFLSHCGWNSILESLQKGVPLIAFPLFGEQKMNAVLLTDGLKVALRPKVNEKGIVERDEIAKLIKSLMEGEGGKEIHERMKHLQDYTANAMREDGSSAKTLYQVGLKWKNLGGIGE
ncbi:hydroquinone glucosyltransferase-like [Prosopis cineraria]|uniref:hydroquinone glucosyltransferase-like n=1 Tax=Prosopis cineraria TaxID=364024 RepID=UPI00240F6618|nr:hydroquinone glucosyltransferase-like [Prosopis cineraria]